MPKKLLLVPLLHLLVVLTSLISNVACNTPVRPQPLLGDDIITPLEGKVHYATIISNTLIYSTFNPYAQEQSSAFLLRAIDLQTNRTLWSNSIEVVAPIIGDDHNLFAVTTEGLIKLLTNSGQIEWMLSDLDIFPSFEDDEIILAEDVIFYSTANNLYAIDSNSGLKLWNQPTPAKQPGSRVVYHEGKIYTHGTINLASRTFGLIAINTLDGTLAWQLPFSAQFSIQDLVPRVISADPVIGNRLLYFSDIYNSTLYAVDYETGHVEWKRDNTILMKPIFHQGSLISVAQLNLSDGSVIPSIMRFNPNNRKTEWNNPLTEIMDSSSINQGEDMVLFDDYLALHSWDNNINQIIVIDATTGKVIIKRELDLNGECKLSAHLSFIFQDDTLYLITSDCVHSFKYLR